MANVVSLLNRTIPRNNAGDPDFKHLHNNGGGEYVPGDVSTLPILNVFSEAEVITLVNRALYQMEYQRTHHRQYSQLQRDREKLIKLALKQAHPGVSFIKATEQQLEDAMKLIVEGKVQL